MPKVTEARLEVRREQILDAAIACFARNGFHQTTMADIAAEAGISPGAIYRYFASKEDVIEASAQAGRQGRAERFQAARQRGDPLQVLDELVDVYVGRATHPDTLMRLGVQLVGEASHNSRVREALRSHWADLLGWFEEIVRRAQVQGEINPALDPSAVARLLVATLDGLAVHQTVDPDLDGDVQKYAEALKALYRGTIGDLTGRRPASDGKS